MHQAEKKAKRKFQRLHGVYTLKRERQTSNVTANVGSRDIFGVCPSRKIKKQQQSDVSHETAEPISNERRSGYRFI